jgi:hypothetical protein
MKLVYRIGEVSPGGGHHFEIGLSANSGGGVSGYASADCGAIDHEYCHASGICDPRRVALMVQAEAMHKALQMAQSALFASHTDAALAIIREALADTREEINAATAAAKGGAA